MVKNTFNNPHHPSLSASYAALLHYMPRHYKAPSDIVRVSDEALKTAPKYSFFYFDALYVGIDSRIYQVEINENRDKEKMKKLLQQFDNDLRSLLKP